MLSKKFSKLIRLKSIELTSKMNASHLGSIFSVVDLISVSFFENIRTTNCPLFDNLRSNFILSKGHAGLAIYLGLHYQDLMSLEDIDSYYSNGSNLSGHVSHIKVDGISFSTGSLGHGMPHAVGRALALKNAPTFLPIVVLMGDGEMNEGTTWESALIASHYNLNNLLIIVDYNKMQSLGSTNEILNLEPLNAKWSSFNFNVLEIDGHNHEQILESYNRFYDYSKINLKPTVIIAHTIKGKGVSFMENNLLYHYSPIKSEKDIKLAIKEISEHEG